MAFLIFRNGPYAGKRLTIPSGKTITLGRNRDIELPLPDLKLSRRHCQIEAGLAGYLLRDMGSTNGTYLNGQRVSGEAGLRNFDRLLIGDTEIEFQCPEDLEEQQTRVGMPEPLKAPGQPSDALEPVTSSSAVEVLKDEGAELPTGKNAAILPPTHPISPPSGDEAKQKELEAALAELDLPLPREPGGAPAAPVADKPKLYFCDACDGSIPEVDLDLGMAKEIEGKLFCKDCLAKGVNVGSGEFHVDALEPVSKEEIIRPTELPSSPPSAPRAPLMVSTPDQDLDEILKGLEEVEEIEVPEGPPRQGKVVVTSDLGKEREQVAAGISGGSTRRMRPMTPEGSPKPAPPPPSVRKKDLDELLGDQFEELEEIANPHATPPAKAAPSNPKAATRPKPDEDDDLIEIG